jgi:iron only hydrogenase large subunit-like protein
MFVGCRIGVLMEMKEKLAPHLVAKQCCAHCTNLAIQAFSSLSIMHHLEDLLQSLHFYFSRSPKKVLELQKLATILNTKGNKILQNVKTR